MSEEMRSKITIEIISEKDLSDDDVIELYQYVKNGCAIFAPNAGEQSPLIGAQLVFGAYRYVYGKMQEVRL